MLNQHKPAESTALLTPGQVEKRLQISRSTRIQLEKDGVLEPVRFKVGGHRRYDEAAVEALALGTAPQLQTPDQEGPL